MVVPMLAPMITPRACRSVIMPTCTKLTVMTVVAELDCMTMVTRAPISTPFTGVLVSEAISSRMRSPARSCSASLISFMPYRKSPTPPIILKMTLSVMNPPLLSRSIRNRAAVRCGCPQCGAGPRLLYGQRGKQDSDAAGPVFPGIFVSSAVPAAEPERAVQKQPGLRTSGR